MNIVFKKMLALSIACFTCFSQTALAAENIKLQLMYDGKSHNYNEKEINLYINNTPLINLEMPPISLDGRTYVPLRAIADAIGAAVAWQPELGEIYITKDNNIVVFQIDNVKASKNGEPFTMEVPAKIVNNRTLVPLRELANAFDCQTKWDNISRTATIITEQKQQNETMADTEVEPPLDKPIATPAAPNTTVTPGTISEIKTATLNGTDEITVVGAAVLPLASQLTEPNRLIFDFSKTQSTLLKNPSAQGLSVVSAIRTGLQENGDFRIVLETSDTASCQVVQGNGQISISVTKGGNSITLPEGPASITLPNTSGNTEAPATPSVTQPSETPSSTPSTIKPPTAVGAVKNMSYDMTKNILKLKKITPMEIATIVHNDDYNHGYYTITLPENFEQDYGTGQLSINNEFLNYVTVSTEAGKTTITFSEKRIRAFWLSEDSEYYYINVKDPKAIYPKIVVLDAGHGGRDPGTNGNGLIEKNIALAIAQKTYQKLEADNNIKVYFIRPDDTYPELAWRASFANDVGDIFVSIHLNTADTNTEKKPLPNGTECLYAEHEADTTRPLSSKMLAMILEKNIIASLGTNNRGVQYRDDLLILNTSKIPTTIVETAFLSNPGDAVKISQSTNQELAAQGIYNGIVEALAMIK